MTRDTGQLTRWQALAGLLLIAATAVGIVRVLALVLEREAPQPPLGAPAEVAAPEPCPTLPAGGRATPPLVTADDLIACPATYDGRHVRYRGEAVRAVLRRGDTAWVHLNDDLYALDLGPLPQHRTTVGGNSGIPVSVSADLADRIRHVGDYRHHGDILQVTGTFLRADPDDGGGPSIRAQHAEIISAGQAIQHPTNPTRTLLAAVLTVAALATITLARLRQRNR